MKKIIFLAICVILYSCTAIFAQAASPDPKTPASFVLLIAEQNIGSPQRAWWASEVDLSTTEAKIASQLIEQGYAVMEPSVLEKNIKQDKGFRVVDISNKKAVQLGSLAKADYVIAGKAIASSGGNVPQSNMLSCFANITVKLVRVKDGKVVAYLDAAGNSAHMDVITGGKEALAKAAMDLAKKIIAAVNK